MNRNNLKKYAPEARRDFIRAVTDRASFYGLTKKKTEPVTVEGDVAVISGRAFPKKVAEQRKQLEEKVGKLGFDQVMEAVAYTWFNRLVAIRYMELHGYLDHGYRVLSHPEGDVTPEIVEHAEHLDLPGLDKQKVFSLKLEGTKESELYRMLLIAQCNALHKAMPFLFEHIGDETELLLPDNLLHSDSLIRTLVNEIPEEDWQEVEIIGWLYQFYISEKKDQVIGKVVKSEDIPAATQLFTPNWIVKYLVQNSLGRQWMATYPNSPVKAQMEYYIEPAEQTPEVQEQLKAITPESLNPEELTLLDPACGSGHILVEAYDLLKSIYQERGYRAKVIPRLILENNLFGLEIDDRAAQLAAFALMMKARADDRRIFDEPVQLHVLTIQDSKGLDAREITEALNAPLYEGGPRAEIVQADIEHLIGLFQHGKTYGSLIKAPRSLEEKVHALTQRVESVINQGGMLERTVGQSVASLIRQTALLASQYTSVVMNPPYMGARGGMNPLLKNFVKAQYPMTSSDLFAAFIERGISLVQPNGQLAMVTMQSWMFLSSFKEMRAWILSCHRLNSMAHLGPRAFSTISGEVVQVAAFILEPATCSGFRPIFFRLIDGNEEQKRNMLSVKTNSYQRLTQDELFQIPGCPLAYWASPTVLRLFSSLTLFGSIGETLQGMTTCDNDFYLRYWWEVSNDKLGIGFASREAAACSDKKWFPYTKGGAVRKWFGNDEHFVNWENNGRLLRTRKHPSEDKIWAHNFNLNHIFREGASYSSLSSGTFACRYTAPGSLFDQKGSMIFLPQGKSIIPFIGLFNSKIVGHITEILCPTLDFNPGSLLKVPVHPRVEDDPHLRDAVQQAIELSQLDWNTNETSPSSDFCNPLRNHNQSTVFAAWDAWQNTCVIRLQSMIRHEQEVNRCLLKIYDLEGEFSPDVSEEEMTLCRPEQEEDIKRLISYAIGCMMGRYSLDEPGLIYAHSGGEGFDPGQYETFPADTDGIIPITDFEWFEDDAANRLEGFIATAWPKEHLEENLKFIADSLGPNKGERPRETIRRYLSTGFYKHHLQLYKKRTIYWLFSSGKQRAFQCLVYLHRYNEGTLSRMRTEYVIPLIGKIKARIERLSEDIEQAGSTSHRRALQKEQDKLKAQLAELAPVEYQLEDRGKNMRAGSTFDEKLRYYADQRIKLDLDDGVKINYGKFGDLLAEVKAITGNTAGE